MVEDQIDIYFFLTEIITNNCIFLTHSIPIDVTIEINQLRPFSESDHMPDEPCIQKLP